MHDPAHVDAVLDLKTNNGFDNRSEAVAKSLPFTTGSMLAAALDALATGKIACSPTSGFHHATYDQCMGFCTFNGLMVTADYLLRDRQVRKVGILDLDHHYGNGTDDIIDRLGLHEQVTHYTIGAEEIQFRSTNDKGKTGAEDFLDRLPNIMELYFADCDILLYQAGADLWEEDPYAWFGGLSIDQLKKRDDIVFEFTKHNKLPVAWNFAGGYKRDENGGIQPVLDIHTNTLDTANKHYR